MRWFRFHLSTALIISLLVGALIPLNMYAPSYIDQTVNGSGDAPPFLLLALYLAAPIASIAVVIGVAMGLEKPLGKS